MKIFKLFTVSQILTVKNCKNIKEALKKADLNSKDVWKIKEVL